MKEEFTNYSDYYGRLCYLSSHGIECKVEEPVVMCTKMGSYYTLYTITVTVN